MSGASDPWPVLGLSRGASVRDVKRRYAELLKGTRPEDDPDGFARLRQAYEACLALVALGEAPAAHESTAPHEPAPEVSQPSAYRDAHDAGEFEAFAALRSPEAVVDALESPPDADGKPALSEAAIRDWIGHSPEFHSFILKEAIERELLRRLLGGQLAFREEAIEPLDLAFGWWQLGAVERLQTLGLPPDVAEHVVDALLRAREDADLRQRERERQALFEQMRTARFAKRDEEEPDVSRIPIDEAAIPRWLRPIGFAARMTFHRKIETYLRPAMAVPILLVATLIAIMQSGSVRDENDLGPLLIIAAVPLAIGAILGLGALAGAALLVFAGRAVIDDPGSFHETVLTLLLPTFAWTADRIAVLVTHWPHAKTFRRGAWTFGLLAIPAALAWFAWSPHAGP